jgi:hypothetical protein
MDSIAILKRHSDVIDLINNEMMEFEDDVPEPGDEHNCLLLVLSVSVNVIEPSVCAAHCSNSANIIARW